MKIGLIWGLKKECDRMGSNPEDVYIVMRQGFESNGGLPVCLINKARPEPSHLTKLSAVPLNCTMNDGPELNGLTDSYERFSVPMF